MATRRGSACCAQICVVRLSGACSVLVRGWAAWSREVAWACDVMGRWGVSHWVSWTAVCRSGGGGCIVSGGLWCFLGVGGFLGVGARRLGDLWLGMHGGLVIW